MRVRAVFGVVAAVATVCGLTAAAQEARPTFRSGIEVVPITAVVRDGRNAIVRDLGRDDFEVLENGVVRPIVDFSATDRATVSLGLLFDTSGSMRGQTFDAGVTVVGTLLDALDHGVDEVSLFTFDKTVRQQTPFTSDPDAVRRALHGISTWGLTSLYDGIAETARRVEGRPLQRRAVIVVTDGLDTSSELTAPEVSGLASAMNVPVYVLVVAPRRLAEPGSARAAGEGDLASLAYWTGGDVVHIAPPEVAAKAIERLMAELRQQYAFTIESATIAGWQRLEVRTRRRGLTVRARSGYFGTPGASRTID